VLLLAAPVLAQDTVKDPSEDARFHLGVIRFTPFLALTDIGVDTNVYNEFEHPKQDTTATVGPGVNYWIKLGRGRLEAKSELTYTWFKTYADQRSLNTNNQAKLSLPLNRLIPFVDGSYHRGRFRPNFEIDARAFQTDAAFGGGLDIRATAKSTIRLEGHGQRVTYRDDQVYLDTSLQETLNRRSQLAGVSLRQSLTPLTTFVVKTEYEQDRFALAEIKDANAVRVMPGFEFDPFALIGGRVFIGYRRFNTLDPLVPDFQGLVGDVEANYRTHATRLDVTFKRDVTYSYQETVPYYLLTDVALTVTQKVTTRWDIRGKVGRQWLDFRTVELETATTGAVLERGYRVGLGPGYRLGESVRLGVDVDYFKRTSDTFVNREYDGLRVTGSISYGLSRQ
jgi:Putative beta-barrel porin 2